MVDIAASLLEFGADRSSLCLLDDDGPSLLPYATLLTARSNSDAILSVVGAVYEWQHEPLMFLVDADLLQGDNHLHRVRRLLAMRGDAPYLGVIAPGRLDVYRIALDNQSLRQSRIKLDFSGGNQATLAQLGNTRPHAGINHRGWIFNVVLKLLTDSITKLIQLGQVSNEDAISLVGRALFTRFLADRNLLPEKMSEPALAANLFGNATTAETTSAWLDSTFNGDLLPLSKSIFKALPSAAYRILGDVLSRAPDGQLFLGWEEKWDNLDFAHIPVGVLSQAYELYLRKHAPRRQRREGGYYTPKPIAELMVRTSFRALEREGKASSARVLDPAAGAGIFLLAAFRELVAERWRADGARPSTRVLRAILYGQIVGFDINEAALRFAALGLYLMSIELDPRPKPVDKLRFDDLRGRVLHLVAAEKEAAAQLGSIGPFIGNEHSGKYDIVIGNPPWSSSTKLADWKFVRSMVARIATARGINNTSPPLPNEVLDLPFVWRALEWAKPNGQIAFALHGRLLFQQGDGMAEARLALFEALSINSIINGSELRQTNVWPGISAPFCILIATNRVPGPGSGFRLISPRLEEALNGAGAMRIDALNADVVSTQQLAETPELLKILFRGTKADLGLLERIRGQQHQTLQKFWQQTIGAAPRGLMLGSGNGYQTLRPSSQVRQRGLRGSDASHLRGIPEVTVSSLESVLIETSTLSRFSLSHVHRSRSREIFTGPLVVVHQSPSAASARINVAVADDSVVYSETFYGYSPLHYKYAAELVRYIALVLGSKLALWMALITSGKFGFEREVVEKATLDQIRLPDFAKFNSEQRSEILEKFDALSKGDLSWEDIDGWVAGLYGLGQRDLELVSDTLEFNLPFAENRKKAQSAPNRQDTEQFCEMLNQELALWSQRFRRSIVIDEFTSNAISPWRCLKVRVGDSPQVSTIDSSDWEGLLRIADETAASEILVRNSYDELLIGRLAQRRYWSDAQAQLLAQRIAWSHLDLLKGHEAHESSGNSPAH